MLDTGSDVAVFRGFQAHVWHFGLYFYRLESRLFCTLGKKRKLVLVLQAVAYILQVRSEINRRAETEVVGFSASLLSKHIEAGLRQIGAEPTTADAAC